MRFVVDAQLPPRLCRWLEQRGHSAIHVTAIRKGKFPDTEIAAWAQRNGQVVISKDADFISLQHLGGFTLVRLRCGNLPTNQLLTWLEPQWAFIEARLLAGQRVVEAT